MKINNIGRVCFLITTYLCLFIQGVFGDGKFSDLEDLIKAVTSIIFISSVGHSAANFAQYDEYAFPPNYPAFLRGKPPNSKVMVWGNCRTVCSHPDVLIQAFHGQGRNPFFFHGQRKVREFCIKSCKF